MGPKTVQFFCTIYNGFDYTKTQITKQKPQTKKIKKRYQVQLFQKIFHIKLFSFYFFLIRPKTRLSPSQWRNFDFGNCATFLISVGILEN